MSKTMEADSGCVKFSLRRRRVNRKRTKMAGYNDEGIMAYSLERYEQGIDSYTHALTIR